MSNYQTLQYLVQFSYDKASLKEIQNALNNIKKLQDEANRQKNNKNDAQQQALHLDKLSRAYVKYTGRLREQSNQTNKYRADLKKLNDIERENGRLTGAQKQQKEAIITAQKQVRQEQSKERSNLIAINQAADITGNSYDNMRMQMKALSVQIRNTQDPLGKNKAAVAMMTKEYDQLNNKLKLMDRSMGNHQRNVGNYTASIRQAASAIAVFQGPLGPLAGRLNSLATTLDRVKAAQLGAAAGTKTLAASVMTFMGMTGLGLLVVMLASVMKFLRGTERGQMALRVSTAGFTAVLSTFTDQIIRFGEFVFKLFENPKESLQTLYNGVRSFISNLVQSTGIFEKVRNVIIDTFENPQEAVKRLNKIIYDNLLKRLDGLVNAYKAAGTVIQGVFELDTEKIKTGSREFADAFIKATTGVDNGIEKIKKTSISLGKGIVDALTPALDWFSETYKAAKSNMEVQMEEEKILNQIILRQRELGVERAKQNAELQKARRFARENRFEMEKGIEVLDAVILAERALAAEELATFKQQLDIQRARTDRFESTIEEKNKLAEMEAQYYAMVQEQETRLMRLIRDRNTLETRRDEINFKRQKDLANQRETIMQLEIDQRINAVRGMYNQLNVLQDSYNARFLSAEAKAQREYLYMVEELARLRQQGFTGQEQAEMAARNVRLRMEREEFDAKKQLTDLEIQFQREKFDTIQDAAVSGLTAIFGESKAVASASTIVDTLKGAQRALADNPPPSPVGIAAAAAVVAKGAIALRKINSTKKGDKSVGVAGSATVANVPTENFGLVESQSTMLPTEIASQLGGMENQFNPVIVLEGEFDSEFLSIKVQEGNNARAGQTIGV